MLSEAQVKIILEKPWAIFQAEVTGLASEWLKQRAALEKLAEVRNILKVIADVLCSMEWGEHTWVRFEPLVKKAYVVLSQYEEEKPDE